MATFFGLWLSPSRARCFGAAGTFQARQLTSGGMAAEGPRAAGLSRWGWEVERRTSAPARLQTATVALDDPKLFDQPFAVWFGARSVAPLTASEMRGLDRFLRLGGMLLVDDSDPADGQFGRSVQRELQRVMPETHPVALDDDHVLYKSFYIVERPVGRVLGPSQIQAIVRGRFAQVLFLSHDLLGALATQKDGTARFDVEPGGARQREQAIRFAVNIAMYVLCLDYKDDQVHAPWLMRRRSRKSP